MMHYLFVNKNVPRLLSMHRCGKEGPEVILSPCWVQYVSMLGKRRHEHQMPSIWHIAFMQDTLSHTCQQSGGPRTLAWGVWHTVSVQGGGCPSKLHVLHGELCGLTTQCLACISRARTALCHASLFSAGFHSAGCQS